MLLDDITPNTEDKNFVLPRGNLESSKGTKVITRGLPNDIDVKDGHKVIAYDTNVYISFSSICVAARAIGKSKQSISEVARGRRPTCHGYFWSYI